MPENIRALIVVVILATAAFFVAGRLARSLVPMREFKLWRNAWFLTTFCAFLSPDILIFFVAMLLICIFVYCKQGVSVDIYIILLLAVPPIGVTLGFAGIQTILELNNGRLLAIVLLFPMLLGWGRSSERHGATFVVPDVLIVSYVLLLILLEFRRSDFTGVLRAIALHSLDVLLPYFAFSRTVVNTAMFRRVSFAFVVAVLPLAVVAVFETAKGWALYNAIAQVWVGGSVAAGRGGMLRAAASAMNSIALGYIIMVALGCSLAIRASTSDFKKFWRVTLAILLCGLGSALSRGPWVGSLVLATIYMATGPNAAANLTRFGVFGAATIGLLLLTPFGGTLVEYVPFLGSGDAGSIEYRQQLFENSMKVIERNLLLGSVDYNSTPEMQAMVQGQGIIDIVNTYLRVTLNSGIVGLGIFVSFFVSILLGLWRISRSATFGELASLARACLATLVGILVTIATVSSVEFIPYVYWSFAGVCVSCVRIAQRERAINLRAAPGIRAATRH